MRIENRYETLQELDDIKEPGNTPKNAEARSRQTDQDKQGKESHDQDKIIERIEEFYTDNKTSIIIHTDPKEVPEITSWEAEAALWDVKNGTATGNDHINIETLKAGEDNITC